MSSSSWASPLMCLTWGSAARGAEPTHAHRMAGSLTMAASSSRPAAPTCRPSCSAGSKQVIACLPERNCIVIAASIMMMAHAAAVNDHPAVCTSVPCFQYMRSSLGCWPVQPARLCSSRGTMGKGCTFLFRCVPAAGIVTLTPRHTVRGCKSRLRAVCCALRAARALSHSPACCRRSAAVVDLQAGSARVTQAESGSCSSQQIP